MSAEKCITCAEYKSCRDSFSSWIFFIIGIVATISVRVVVVLMGVNPLYAKIAWYIGICGFFVFFIYKFRVSQNRKILIKRHGLTEKINHKRELTGADYNLLGALLCSLSSKKEMINYLFIFALSAVALVLAVFMDFIK